MHTAKQPTTKNIGALKLALTNTRTYQEGIDDDKELYDLLNQIQYALTDIIQDAEADQ